MFQPTLDNNSNRLDLYNLVTHHLDATFFARYEGTDLDDLNIYTNDVLVIDKSIKPIDGKIAVLIKDGEFSVEKISSKSPTDGELDIWGVVSYVIHKT